MVGRGRKRGTKRKRPGAPQPEEPNLLLSRGEQQLVELRECEDLLRRSLPHQNINQTHGFNITLRDEIRPAQGPPEMVLIDPIYALKIYSLSPCDLRDYEIYKVS